MTRPRLVFERWWWLLPASLWGVGLLAGASLPSAHPWLRLGGGLLFDVLILATTVLHELGHVAAAAAVGHSWTVATVTWLGMSVTIEPHETSGWPRITRSAAGPLMQIVAGAAMAATISREPWDDLWHGLSWWLSGRLGEGGVQGEQDVLLRKVHGRVQNHADLGLDRPQPGVGVLVQLPDRQSAYGNRLLTGMLAPLVEGDS